LIITDRHNAHNTALYLYRNEGDENTLLLPPENFFIGALNHGWLEGEAILNKEIERYKKKIEEVMKLSIKQGAKYYKDGKPIYLKVKER